MSLGELNVSMVSGGEIIAVDPTTAVDDVAVTLAREGIGAVIVGPTSAPWGIVSERDIVQAIADGRDLTTTTASTIAHPFPLTVDEETSIDDAARLMMESWLRHLLVSSDGRIVGILSARDLLGLYCTEEEPVT